MKLIALVIALLLERLATHLFHLRSPRWLDRFIDPVLGIGSRIPGLPPVLLAVLVVALLALPVLGVWFLIDDTLLGVPYVVFSVVVLFFSLGPEDIGEEVENWCRAVEAGEEERAGQLAKAILECDPRPNYSISDAIFVQGNNRFFSVVFWFVLLGPVGAATMRIADLVRRRALFQQARADEQQTHEQHLPEATETVHAVLAWLPARLTAIGYLLAGSFDSGWSAWGRTDREAEADLGGRSDQLLARVGCAAMSQPEPINPDDESHDTGAVAQARAALQLVMRALFFWAATVAALTLFGPAI